MQGSESEARSSEPPYMFRPVQNPDDEEAEGRIRTRTRTKELVSRIFSLLIGLSHLELVFFFCCFFSTERAESTN